MVLAKDHAIDAKRLIVMPKDEVIVKHTVINQG
jgi:hypothetical protein